MQQAQGNLAAALASYQASLDIRDRLAKSDPGNTVWQRDLSVSYIKVGDVEVAQGNLPAALTSYQSSLAIVDRLAKSDPSNAGWQHDLSRSYIKVGDVQTGSGQSGGRADLLSGGPRHQGPPGEIRSRQCRLAARSLFGPIVCRRVRKYSMAISLRVGDCRPA